MPTAPPSGPMTLAVRACLATACTFWAVSFLATRVALASTPPLVVVATRLVISALCFVAFFGLRVLVDRARGSAIRPVLPFGWADLGPLVVLSLLGTGLHYGIQTIGLLSTTASNGSLWAASGPITILVLSVLVGGERLDLRKVAGIALALVGSLVVLGADTLRGFELRGHVTGDLLVLASIVMWGVFTVYGRRLSAERGALETLGATTIIGATWMIPVGWAEASWRHFSLAQIAPSAWAAIAFLGFGCSFLATLLYFVALARTSAQQVGVWMYAIPPMTFLAAGLFLGEPIGWSLLVGAALVLAGVRLTELGPSSTAA